MRQQISKAQKHRTTELLHSQREEDHKNKWVFNITYYPISSKLSKNILCKIHLLLARNREHRKVFENVPIKNFRKGMSLKDILVRAKVVVAINQGVKLINILPKYTNLNHHLRSAYVPLDSKI